MITSTDTTYTTELEADVFNLDDGIYPKIDTIYGNATIEWSLDIEHKSWGIKGFYFNIHSIDLQLTIETINEEEHTINPIYANNDEKSFGYEVQIDDSEIEFEHKSIRITDLQVDYKEKVVTVIFG